MIEPKKKFTKYHIFPFLLLKGLGILVNGIALNW